MSVMYSSRHCPNGSIIENPQQAPPGKRTTVAGPFSFVTGLCITNCFDDHATANSDVAPISPGPCGNFSTGATGVAAGLTAGATTSAETRSARFEASENHQKNEAPTIKTAPIAIVNHTATGSEEAFLAPLGVFLAIGTPGIFGSTTLNFSGAGACSVMVVSINDTSSLEPRGKKFKTGQKGGY